MPVTLPVTLIDGTVPVANDFMQNYIALKTAIDALSIAGTVIPPGVIEAFAGPVVPTGWLTCDGSAVSRSGFSGLFAVIGTTWGVGDGSTTFNLPDLRGRAPIGAGLGTGLSARTLASLFGEETHRLTAGEMPAHGHGVTDPGHSHPLQSASTQEGGSQVAESANSSGTIFTLSALTGISIQSAGGGGVHNNMPPSAVVQWIIKV